LHVLEGERRLAFMKDGEIVQTETYAVTPGERYPFRLGTTSYILPADILPNVAFLADRVDDIELLLFESDEYSNLPDRKTIAELRRYQVEHRLSYTVHLPLDLALGSTDETRRIASLSQCRRIFDRVRDLAAFGYILHLCGSTDQLTSPAIRDRWRDSLTRSAEALVAEGAPPARFCVETLSYPFEWVADIVEAFDLSVCLDVGHLLVHGFDVSDYFERYFQRCRVIHLHGVADGRDHLDLSTLDPAIFDFVLGKLSDVPTDSRVLTMEIFSQPDFERSLSAFRARLPRGR
jgi:sugar phosphate isomerase/epimerase